MLPIHYILWAYDDDYGPLIGEFFYTGAFLAEFLGPIFDFRQGLDIKFEFRFPKRFDPCVRPRCPSNRA